MTDDERTDQEKRIAELRRLGIARGGIAMAGTRAGYVPTAQQILERILPEHADFRKQLAELQKRIELLEAAETARRQRGGRNSKAKPRRKRTTLVHKLDAAVRELEQQEKKASLSDAAKHFYRTSRAKWWATLAAPEKEREASNLVRRYHRGKAHPKKTLTTR